MIQAADQSHTRAQHNFGFLCTKGRDVPQSDERAAHWFGKAAEQGLPEAASVFHFANNEDLLSQAAAAQRQAAEQVAAKQPATNNQQHRDEL